ncbi:MAG: hypothetical protein ACYSX0_14020 [Planctomycetota bacterium]|jgi:hypothetical protein
MSTLYDLWNNYWWVLPVALMFLCVLGCILGGRRDPAGCCACAPKDQTGPTRSQ